MSEMKCPCCGGPVQQCDDPYASSFIACNSENDECMFVCDIKNFSRISAAMDLARAEVNRAETIKQTDLDEEIHDAYNARQNAHKRVLEVFGGE